MKTFTIIYTVTESILAITAIVFLAISIFGNPDTNLPLQIALGSTGLAGILTLIYQIRKTKKEKQAKE
jgi:ABC-type uncharacterized transport system permease subunit